MNKKKFLVILLRSISVLLLLTAVILSFFWFSENNHNTKLISEIRNNVTCDENLTFENTDITYKNVNFDELSKFNPNSIAWIKVNNTNIDYPVVQYTDNDYYLTHSIDNSYNSSGWIFMDYRNNTTDLDKNTIIYGHNRLNNSMFANLKKTLEKDWYMSSANRYLTFRTPSNLYVGKIFSIYVEDKNDTYYSNINFTSDEDFTNFINNVKNKSIYNFNVSIIESDKIITLYTCTDNSKNRIILHAKLIEV